MRRIALLVVLIGLLCADSAHAQATISVPSVTGRVIYAYRYSGTSTLLTQVVVVGATAGTEIEFRFVQARLDATVGAGGFHDFKTVLPKIARPGGGWVITLTNPNGHSRTLTFQARAKRPPLLKKTCTDATGSTACEITCPADKVYADPDINDPCQTATSDFDIPHSLTSDAFSGNRKYTQVKKLTISHIPRGATVVLLCRAKHQVSDCPFYVRSGLPIGGKVNVAAGISYFKFRPGTQLLIWVLRGMSRGNVVRYTFRSGQLPRFEQLCMPRESLTPTQCSRSD